MLSPDEDLARFLGGGTGRAKKPRGESHREFLFQAWRLILREKGVRHGGCELIPPHKRKGPGVLGESRGRLPNTER